MPEGGGHVDRVVRPLEQAVLVVVGHSDRFERGLDRSTLVDRPAYGAIELAKIAKRVQDTPGEQHHSVVVRQTLEHLGAAAILLDETAFTYGRLHRTEQDLGEDAEARFEKLLRRIPKSLRQA